LVPSPLPSPQLLIQDNLELGCTFIEKAATDRALRDVDKALAAQYEARILARQRNLPFPERNPYALVAPGRFPGALPESLQPKPGQAAQQRVYEDFTRLPKVAPMATRAEGAAGGQVRGG
jgi:CCR4-NOT transcription complex subunit 1